MKTRMPTGDFHRCCGIKVLAMILTSGDKMLIMTGQPGETCCLTSFIINFNDPAPRFGGVFIIVYLTFYKNTMELKKIPGITVSKKIKRIVIRTVLIVAGLYLLLLVALSIYISSSQERLIAFIKSKLKETLLGELRIDKAEITVWQTFPKLGITLNNVVISDSFYHRPF